MREIIKKIISKNKQAGMTYVELIVVLSIFAVVTGTVIFNYQDFQEKVDIKNLANDVALKFVEAQKNSTSGKLPWFTPPDGWKPSYGIYINTTSGTYTGDKVFYSFIDVFPVDKKFDGLMANCPTSECIERFLLTKGNFINDKYISYLNGNTDDIPSGISMTYTRPDSTMTVRRDGDSAPLQNVNYVFIRLESPGGKMADLYIYASGRIEIR